MGSMSANLASSSAPQASLSPVRQLLAAVACLAAGALILASHWLPGEILPMAYAFALAGITLGVTLAARRAQPRGTTWPIAFAFFVFALVQFLNAVVEWSG